eukprot:COSAG02_NODE_8918_length_2400_cov_3.677097_2_plen_337_part_00
MRRAAEEDEHADAPPTSKQRAEGCSEGEREQTAAGTSGAARPAAISTIPNARAEASGPSPAEKACSEQTGVELRCGMQLEVRWVVEQPNEETGESTSEAIWWGCTLGDAVASEDKATGDWEWKLTYDAMLERGFDAEDRTVSFVAKHLLVDLQTRRASAASGGGLEEGVMQWRVAGDEHEPPELLHVGTRIKARWQGQEEFHAGRVAGLNMDGTYRVDYADGHFEESVTRDLMEVVEVEAAVEQSEEEDAADDDDVVMGTDAMFDLVIGRMVQGPAFSSLAPDKQRQASEKIAGLKVLFEAELEQLKAHRGAGALVTQQDVMQILPRILAAERRAA